MDIPQRDSKGCSNGTGNGKPPPSTPPERDPGPGAHPDMNSNGATAASKPPGMAFTISFGDDEGEGKETVMKKGPKMAMSGNLSQFLPSKVRRSFRQREMEKELKEVEEGKDSSGTDVGEDRAKQVCELHDVTPLCL